MTKEIEKDAEKRIAEGSVMRFFVCGRICCKTNVFLQATKQAYFLETGFIKKYCLFFDEKNKFLWKKCEEFLVDIWEFFIQIEYKFCASLLTLWHF